MGQVQHDLETVNETIAETSNNIEAAKKTVSKVHQALPSKVKNSFVGKGFTLAESALQTGKDAVDTVSTVGELVAKTSSENNTDIDVSASANAEIGINATTPLQTSPSGITAGHVQVATQGHVLLSEASRSKSRYYLTQNYLLMQILLVLKSG